jgi:hypothetical protein
VNEDFIEDYKFIKEQVSSALSIPYYHALSTLELKYYFANQGETSFQIKGQTL